MGIVAIVPLASMAAANAALQAAGWSQPGWAPCFSVPAYGNGNPTHAACHAYGPAALITAIKAVSGVVFNEGTGDPAARLRTLLSGVAQWGDDAPALPTSGNARGVWPAGGRAVRRAWLVCCSCRHLYVID